MSKSDDKQDDPKDTAKPVFTPQAPAPKSSGEKPKERPSGGGRSKSSLGG